MISMLRKSAQKTIEVLKELKNAAHDEPTKEKMLELTRLVSAVRFGGDQLRPVEHHPFWNKRSNDSTSTRHILSDLKLNINELRDKVTLLQQEIIQPQMRDNLKEKSEEFLNLVYSLLPKQPALNLTPHLNLTQNLEAPVIS